MVLLEACFSMVLCLWWVPSVCHPLECNLSNRWHGNVLFEQPSQHLAPSKGCADLVFFLVAFLAKSSVAFAIHLTNVFNMLFPCIQIFSQKRHLSWATLWLLMDLLFLLIRGSYITPFWWVLLFQNNSAGIHKVAQCVIPMQILYMLIYFIHHIRTGPLHMSKLFSSWICMPCQPHKVTSGQITVTVSSHQFGTQGTKTWAKSWLTVLHRTQSIVNIPAKTVNN